MKKILTTLSILFSAFYLCAQEPVQEAVLTTDSLVAHTDSTTAAETSKPLTDEEKLCKSVAEDIMMLYGKWDVAKDYEILIPRISRYVDEFYGRGNDPDSSNKKDMVRLRELYVNILGKVSDEYYRGILNTDIERIDSELNGQQKNPALIGYADKMDFDRLKIIEEFVVASTDPEIVSFMNELRSILRNIRRYSIGFDNTLDNVYEEITRVTDKRVYFLYIEDWVKQGLERTSGTLADVVNSKEEEFQKHIDSDVEDIYAELTDAREKDDKAATARLYYQWTEARKVNIDRVKTDEVSRLSSIVSGFLVSPGVYDINQDLIFKIKTDSENLRPYLENLLKIKFYNDLNSRFRVYSRFAVEKGFREYRVNVLIGTFMFFILFFYVFATVRKKRETIFIRRIPGLDAIDDAIGRATEMGKPVIYDSGIGGWANVQTIASMLILRNVAKRVAEFKAEIIYPAYDPIVLQIAEEMIGSGFLDAGYPEDHKKSNCFFLVQDQFPYAAGLAGIVSRIKPATAFHFGSYAAESLLISEAGFAAGAIQVAGTVDASQLPFFITACDYTLIGEELYAAAAYLSREAQVLSNLKLSDYGKVIFGVMFLLGTILLTINPDWTIIVDILDTH